MAKIIKKGFVIPFDCGICECSFVVGIRLLKPNDGNFYYNCPTCGNECHTDVAKIPSEYHEAVEIAVKRSKNTGTYVDDTLNRLKEKETEIRQSKLALELEKMNKDKQEGR